MKPSELLELHRDEIRKIILSHNVLNPRVFGSILYGTDTETSDLDIVVDPTDTTSLMDVIDIELELEKLLNIPIDVMLPSEKPGYIAIQVMKEALPI